MYKQMHVGLASSEYTSGWGGVGQYQWGEVGAVIKMYSKSSL